MALQEANLAYHYPIIFWNCANLISDSGGEDGNTKYDKIAAAVSNFQKAGITITLPNINKSEFGFSPDAQNNQIIYGLKPIQGVGSAVAKAIIDNRPYTSMWDFYEKMQSYKADAPENKFGDVAMITLIKAGCFDELEGRPREEIMRDFIRFISNPIKSLSMSNIEDLNEAGLLTPEQKKYELRLYRFRNYVFQKQNLERKTGKSASTGYYRLDHKFAEPFFFQYFESEMTEGKDYEYNESGYILVKRGGLDRVFGKLMEDFKNTVLTNQEFLDKINEQRFQTLWREKVPGTISKWEMDSLSFYYSGHELAEVDREGYSIANFDELPDEPEVSDEYWYRGQLKPRFKLCRLAGTVISRNKDHNTVSLLTLDGVVNVKFYKGQFGFYDKQIARVNEDGTKTVLEKSWFSKGTKLLITGFKRGENFWPRRYKDSLFRHSVQLIKEIKDDGSLVLQSDRVDEDGEVYAT